MLFAVFLHFENNAIEVTTLNVTSNKLPKEFDGFRIAHMADLHSKTFSKDQEPLLSKVRAAKPDIIFFTGDIVDRKNYLEKPGLLLIDGLLKIAPVYFVTGNHEFWSGRYDSLQARLSEREITLLRNESVTVSRGGSTLDIVGIDDPAITADRSDEAILVPEELRQALQGRDREDFQLLLAHRPDLIPTYADHRADVVFSGHAHGGQWRLPYIGGLFAPDQGLFPKYTAGKYRVDGSTLVVTRGLGNSVIPQRLFNRPELVIVNLQVDR